MTLQADRGGDEYLAAGNGAATDDGIFFGLEAAAPDLLTRLQVARPQIAVGEQHDLALAVVGHAEEVTAGAIGHLAVGLAPPQHAGVLVEHVHVPAVTGSNDDGVTDNHRR